MLEEVVVQRLGEHGGDAAPREVGRQCQRVGADVRIRRTELGQARIAEAGLLGEARIAVLCPVDVQEHRPGLHVEPARAGRGDQRAQRIAVLRQPARPRLEGEAAPAGRVGPEKTSPPGW